MINFLNIIFNTKESIDKFLKIQKYGKIEQKSFCYPKTQLFIYSYFLLCYWLLLALSSTPKASSLIYPKGSSLPYKFSFLIIRRTVVLSM